MKRSASLRSQYKYRSPRRGVALLLVLSCLVLLAALILGFLLSGQNNLKSSKLYANGSSVRTLADSTVSLVMAQIQQATSNGTTVAWASQPGMIRTYDNTGAPLTNYRLFSWDSPTLTGTYDALTDSGSLTTTGSAAWYNSPAVFYDLNQPVADSAGILHYPIVDGSPTALGNSNGTTSNYTTADGTAVSTYALNSVKPAVEGFWVGMPNAATGPAVNLGKTTNAPNYIPMPVKWLYVLKDGTMVVPTPVSSSGSQVTVTGASTANPIVGRMAYWTDDETSKVNINTASEGAYWDQPRSQGTTDFNLATMQPVQNEFQRYPGHPATTSLSTVFGSISYIDPTLIATNPLKTSISGSLSFAPYKFYYDLAPKLNADTGSATGTNPATSPDNEGSRAGTVIWYYSGNPTATVPNGTGAATTGGWLTAKNPGAVTGTTGGDRLFTSVDELLFASNLFTDNVHTASATPTGGGTPPTRPQTNNAITPQFVEQSKFFLTTSSRAPDVNLFNQPRVGTWPVSVKATTNASDSTYLTTLDTAIAWCGTLNSKSTAKYKFFFQRDRNDHPTNDLPSTTGTGLNRNRNLLNYLTNLTSQNIPGFGGNFLAKYPAANIDIGGTSTSVAERDQILTEIFDYIRCLNLQDGSTAATTFHQFAPTASGTLYPTAYASSTVYYDNVTYPVAPGIRYAGGGQVVPIYDTVTKTKGFGRFPTVAEISIMFVCTGWNDGNGGTNTADPNYAATNAVPATAANGAYIMLSSGGYAPWGYYNDGTNSKPSTSYPGDASAVPPIPAAAAPGPLFNANYMSNDKDLTPASATPNSVATSLCGTTGTLQVRPIIVVSFFDPSSGFVQESPTFSFQLCGLDSFRWPDGTAMFPQATGPGVNHKDYHAGGGPNMGNNAVCPAYSNMPLFSYAGSYAQGFGGNLGFRQYITGNTIYSTGDNGGYNFIGTAHNFSYNPATATTANMGTFAFSGGALTANILLPSTGVNTMVDARFASLRNPTPGWPPSPWPLSATGVGVITDLTPLQQIKVQFPSATLPLPYYPTPGASGSSGDSVVPPYVDRGHLLSRLDSSWASRDWRSVNQAFTYPGDVIRSVRAVPGDMRIIAGRVSVTDTSTNPEAAPGLFDPTQTQIRGSGLTGWDYFNASGTYQVHSLIDSLSYPFYGAILGQLVPGIAYAPNNSATWTTSAPVWKSTSIDTSCGAGNCALATGAIIPTSKISWSTASASGIAGDWDNGFSFVPDGSYINKPDEGQASFYYAGPPVATFIPYFSAAGGWNNRGVGAAYFSPARMMPGPGMFGSLSTGVIRNIPWMTLLFCPNPEGGPAHPGFGVGNGGVVGPTAVAPYTIPPDHLWLDLFTMPVVEPYPISEPLSTAGRVNMNYQIVPFTYIQRSTAVRAVLKSEKIIAISDDAGPSYKKVSGDGSGTGPDGSHDFRLPINLDQTLRGFDYYFSSTRDIFRSASQICNMYLYPVRDANGSTTNAPTWDSANDHINRFWYGVPTPAGNYTVSTSSSSPTHFLTGDNSRERPYTTIYPRLTTKSNTFTVHYCVQTLQKTPAQGGADPSLWAQTWDESKDVVTGQYRGSTIVERYVDPNDNSLPDFAAAGGTYYNTALDSWYKFRVVSTKQFAP